MKLFSLQSTAFENFDTTVRTFLSKIYGALGMEYTPNQIFGVIFETIKSVMQNVMFYIEDAFTEQNIYTATRQKSIYSLAKVAGYEPYYGAAAIGTIMAKLIAGTSTDTGTTKIYVPNGCKIVNGTTGKQYLLMMPTDYYIIDISKPLISHEFTIIQGIMKTVTYVSEGYSFETIKINETYLFDKNYIYVYVDGIAYTRAYNIYDMSNYGFEYVVTVGFENEITIMFGNNTHGKKLSSGQNIVIRYISHDGTAGNITDISKASLSFAGNGTDTLGNSINLNNHLKLSIINCISGGTDADSVGFVRTMIGTNSRSLVLANEDNFRLFFKRFSFIGNMNIWSNSNTMKITCSCLSNYLDKITTPEEYFNLDMNQLLLTDEQKKMILNTLDQSNKVFAGVTLEFKSPIIRNYAIICYVKINNSYNKDSCITKIKNLLGKYFIYLPENTQFIAKSDIIANILNADSNILAVDITILSETSERCYYNGYYLDYQLKYVNKQYVYQEYKVIYEPDKCPGLDNFGNIELKSKIEIPILHGKFKYYPNKSNYDKNTSITIDPVQIYFI